MPLRDTIARLFQERALRTGDTPLATVTAQSKFLGVSQPTLSKFLTESSTLPNATAAMWARRLADGDELRERQIVAELSPFTRNHERGAVVVSAYGVSWRTSQLLLPKKADALLL